MLLPMAMMNNTKVQQCPETTNRAEFPGLLGLVNQIDLFVKSGQY